MHPVPLIGLAVAALLISAVWTALRHDRRRAAARDAAERDAAGATAAPDLAAPRGACRFCDRRAEHRVPRVVIARPWFDPVLRWLGVVAAVKFQLELEDRDLDAPVDHCRWHWERARALCGVEIGEAQADYARWLDAKARALIAFQVDGLAARIVDDEVAPRRRRARGGAAGAPAAVVSIGAVRAGDGRTG